MGHSSPILSRASAAIILSSVALAERPGITVLPFPARDARAVSERVEFSHDSELLELLRFESSVVLVGVPWSSGIDLDLERCPDPAEPGAFHVDGRPAGDGGMQTASFWRGRVRGEQDSDVFLGFAGGVWGWIQRADELVHVLSLPADAGDGQISVLIDERALNARGSRFKGLCMTAAPRGGQVVNPAALGTAASSAGSARPPRMLFGTLAIETDWQFFQLFGDLNAARGYVMSLLAAANSRFRVQVGVHLTASYLGFYTTPADPWLAQDAGGNCFDVLYEFQDAWRDGAAPVPSDLHHLLSGVDLGCGVAFLDALCDPAESFSLTSRMDGLTPFPVAASTLNWDFVWMCHELGHNFGTGHTHEYCPPLDECSPSGYFGPCQDEMACTNQGTMMSYCHACPGGMSNFTTWFHPVVQQTMRSASEASCLRSFQTR